MLQFRHLVDDHLVGEAFGTEDHFRDLIDRDDLRQLFDGADEQLTPPGIVLYAYQADKGRF